MLPVRWKDVLLEVLDRALQALLHAVRELRRTVQVALQLEQLLLE